MLFDVFVLYGHVVPVPPDLYLHCGMRRFSARRHQANWRYVFQAWLNLIWIVI